MYGNNPKRGPEKGDGSIVQVVEIFPTLQGEGPFAGHPAVFVRLGGCNLACDFCDTEFESFHAMPMETVLETVMRHAPNIDLVVITGGEPLRQEIGPLCAALLANGLRVQIETNGTLWRDLPPDVHLVCSPKVTNGAYHPIRPEVLERAAALKFIISTTRPHYGAVGEVGQSIRPLPVYVQPMDEGDAQKNHANARYAASLAQTHGYRLSLQTHKILGIP
jgi:organic radical activating enzyme